MKHLWGREGQRLKYHFGEGQKARLERRDALETAEGEEEWGEEGCQEAKAGHRVGLRAAVELCQCRSCLAGTAGAGWPWVCGPGSPVRREQLGQARAGGCERLPGG